MTTGDTWIPRSWIGPYGHESSTIVFIPSSWVEAAERAAAARDQIVAAHTDEIARGLVSRWQLPQSMRLVALNASPPRWDRRFPEDILA